MIVVNLKITVVFVHKVRIFAKEYNIFVYVDLDSVYHSNITVLVTN
jgi:hypothetical protein